MDDLGSLVRPVVVSTAATIVLWHTVVRRFGQYTKEHSLLTAEQQAHDRRYGRVVTAAGVAHLVVLVAVEVLVRR